MKIGLLFLASIFSAAIFSQSCLVSLDSLKGQYTGDCRKGKANGFGTAIGRDTYTGYFKDGYPEGEGKYTWKDGTWYDGNWKAGLFDGNGTFNKIDASRPDSATLITGFWQGGKYVGKYQKPFSAVALTNGVNDLSARKIRSSGAEITITVTSTTAGASSLYNAILPKPQLVKIDLLQGLFQQQADNATSPQNNRYTLRKVTFPFHAILTFETPGTNQVPRALEKIEIELSDIGNWYIQVKIEN